MLGKEEKNTMLNIQECIAEVNYIVNFALYRKK